MKRHGKQINHGYYYDEAKTRTRKKQSVVAPKDHSGVNSNQRKSEVTETNQLNLDGQSNRRSCPGQNQGNIIEFYA